MIQDLRRRIAEDDLVHGTGARGGTSVPPTWTASSAMCSSARPMKVVIDCGNGVAGAIAPALFHRLGCELVDMFCEVDGRFPTTTPTFPGRRTCGT